MMLDQMIILFAEMKAEIAVATEGQEGGKLSLGVVTHDGETQYGLVIQDGNAEDEIDATIGNGAASMTTVSGDLNSYRCGYCYRRRC